MYKGGNMTIENEMLIKKKKELEKMQFQFNISKLEVRLLELDEEKLTTEKSIEEQKKKLLELQP